MNIKKLSELKKGERAQIIDIVENNDFGPLDFIVTQRLADLGFCKMTELTIIAHGLFGLSKAVRLENGSQFSLRKYEASKVHCVIL